MWINKKIKKQNKAIQNVQIFFKKQDYYKLMNMYTVQ